MAEKLPPVKTMSGYGDEIEEVYNVVIVSGTKKPYKTV
jgi:hypothetical protein